MKLLRQIPPPGELGFFQSRNHPEDPHLLAMLQLGLKPDHVPQSAERVVLPQLDDRIGPASGAGVVEASRLHRPVAERVDPALCHDLNGHAVFEGVARSQSLKGIFSPSITPGRSSRTAACPSGS
jgi:hypothetical protein